MTGAAAVAADLLQPMRIMRWCSHFGHYTENPYDTGEAGLIWLSCDSVQAIRDWWKPTIIMRSEP